VRCSPLVFRQNGKSAFPKQNKYRTISTVILASRAGNLPRRQTRLFFKLILRQISHRGHKRRKFGCDIYWSNMPSHEDHRPGERYLQSPSILLIFFACVIGHADDRKKSLVHPPRPTRFLNRINPGFNLGPFRLVNSLLPKVIAAVPVNTGI
jgi:hypothetical protein